MRHFEFYVAVRYLLARRKQAFLSLISLISTVGVSVGVMALVIALALMTGLQQELRDRIVGSAAHVYVWKVGEGGIDDYSAEVSKLNAQPHVLGAAPAVLGKALVTTDKGEGFITVKGIDPVLETRVTDIERAMQSGGLAALTPASETDPDGIVIGNDLARRLGVVVGDSVSVLTPHGSLSPMGMMPRTRRLQVVGIFTLGLFEFDSAYGFVSLPVAQRLVDRDRPDFVQLRIDDIYAAPQVAEQLSADLGTGYITQDWADLNQSLFSALWLEKMAISITIGLIVMVAALNIVASLILLVMEKSRDIAILKTMGASANSIMTHLPDAGPDHRDGGHDGRRTARRGRVVGVQYLQADPHSHGRLPGVVRAVPHRAVRLRDGGARGGGRSVSSRRFIRRARPPASIQPRRCGTSRPRRCPS